MARQVVWNKRAVVKFENIMPNNKLNILTLLSLFFLISSCDGQKNSNQIEVKNQQIKGSEINDQISEVVRMMFQDSKGNIWFGTQNGAFKITNDKLDNIETIKSEFGNRVTIKDITEDRNGKIWLGHTDGLSSVDDFKVTNYYESDGLLSNDVWSIETDSKGNVWIGTINGLCIFNGQKFTNFELPEGEIDKGLGISSTKMIHSILEDKNENIWICTNAGLFKYANNILTNVSKKIGIQTNFVNDIIERRNGEFIISTKEAVFKMHEDSLINITDDIEEIGKGAGSIAEDKDGNIWFVLNQHHMFTYDGTETVEFKKTKDNKGPVIFQIFKDQKDRLWCVGYGGAYRLENGKFINIKKNGPW